MISIIVVYKHTLLLTNWTVQNITYVVKYSWTPLLEPCKMKVIFHHFQECVSENLFMINEYTSDYLFIYESNTRNEILKLCSQEPSIYVYPLNWRTNFRTHSWKLAKLQLLYSLTLGSSDKTGRQEILDWIKASIPRI
jgi:hypothetical protein